MTDSVHKTLRQRLNGTGIGFAGIEGVWWRPAPEPFPLSKHIAQQLEAIGPALLAFVDAVVGLYQSGSSRRLKELLGYRVPDLIPRLVVEGHLESLRPDFQLCPVGDDGSSLRLVVTELEICPSAHGFAHAMQWAYGQRTDLVEEFARYLDGRALFFVGTQAWSEFLFEQLAFCRALEEVGASGRVLYDLPLAALAKEVRQGVRWQPPLFGIPYKTQGWNDDVIGRVRTHRLERFIWLDDTKWPQDIGDSVVFRFGYFDCFSNHKLRYFQQWQENGVQFLNPTIFFLENKAIMAAIHLPEVRQELDEQTLTVLDQCIPQTVLLTQESVGRVLDEKDDWVVKYAAYDGGNQAWGGRSLAIGQHHTRDGWRNVLEDFLALPWPTVAQQAIATTRINQDYLDEKNKRRQLRDGRTRLRTFIIRDESSGTGSLHRATACGSHITVSSGEAGVAEGIHSVQAPVVFI